MKTKQANFLTLILTVCLSTALIQAQPGSVEKTGANVSRFNGATEVKFSPSGKLMIIQTDVGFYYFPTARLDEVFADFDRFRDSSSSSWVEGQAKAFLPVSEKIVFSSRRGLHALDARTGKTQPIFQMTAKDEENGNYLGDGEMVIVSENLIISSDGGWDLGMDKGNILRFDVPRARVKRAARINGFRYAWLSPSGKYVLYDHAGEDTLYADLYDIERDINYPIPKRFNFKSHFPKYKKTLVQPLGWFGADKFIATVDENQFEEFKASPNPLDMPDTPAWLVMFDAGVGKIIWKRQLNEIDAPVHLEQLNESKAFFDSGDKGRYEVSLADGNLTKLPDIGGDGGTGFTFSPDKTRVAFFDQVSGRRVFVASPNGSDKKLVIEIPEKVSSRGVVDKDTTSINWSPDGKRLLVLDGYRLFIVRVEN